MYQLCMVYVPVRSTQLCGSEISKRKYTFCNYLKRKSFLTHFPLHFLLKNIQRKSLNYILSTEHFFLYFLVESFIIHCCVSSLFEWNFLFTSYYILPEGTNKIFIRFSIHYVIDCFIVRNGENWMENKCVLQLKVKLQKKIFSI